MVNNNQKQQGDESSLSKRLESKVLNVSISVLILFMLVLTDMIVVKHYFDSVENIKSTERQVVQKQINLFQTTAEATLKWRFNDLQFVQSLFKRQLDPQTDSSMIQQELLDFVNNREVYFQVRWIDPQGMERIRIDRDCLECELSVKTHLQDKSKRDYFVKGIELPIGNAFISDLDLNVEFGRVEIPFVPTLRFGVRIADAAGKDQGMVILNYSANDLLKRAQVETAWDFWILNQQGFWVRANDARWLWGHSLKDSTLNASVKFPDAWQKISSQPEGFYENSEGLFAFKTGLLKQVDNQFTHRYFSDITALQPEKLPFKIVAHLSRDQLDVIKRESLFMHQVLFVVSTLLWLGVLALMLKFIQSNQRRVFMTQLNDRLTFEVAQQTQDLATSKAKQEQLFAIAVHEFGNTLSALKLLQNEQKIRNCEPYGITIEETTDALLDNLEDFKAVMYPERAFKAKQIKAAPAEVLNRTLKSLKGLLVANNFHLEMVTDNASHQACLFNQQILRQILNNLVKNAIVHSGGSALWIKMHALPLTEQTIELRVSVEDNGKGIAADKVSVLFQPGERGDTRADGEGLGLHICSEFAKALNGELHYRDSEHGGSCFELQCVLSLVNQSDHEKPEKQFDAKPVESSGRLKAKRVLYIDDDEILRNLTRYFLEEHGAKVTVAQDESEALKLCAKQTFDIVLTDYLMPTATGLEIAEALQKMNYPAAVYLLTASSQFDDAQLQRLGIKGVLSKPLDIEELEQQL